MAPELTQRGVGEGWGSTGRHPVCYAPHNKINSNRINHLQVDLTSETCFGNLITVNEAERPRETNSKRNTHMTTSITSKTLSNETAQLVITWAKASDKADAAIKKGEDAQTLMLDALIADGVNKAAMLKGAGKGKENTTLYTSIVAALVTTLPTPRQNSLTANIDTMTKKQKAYRRESMQRVGSKMGKLRKALEKRLAPSTPSTRAPQTPTGATPSATPENNTSATPLKSYIEKVSTGYDMVNKISPTSITSKKVDKIKKMIGDLIEELNAIK